jgi:lysophospholipase L1-like esterase
MRDPGAPTGYGFARRWAPRLALALASVVLLLLALELALRVFQPFVEIYNPVGGLHVSDPELGWLPRPGLRSRLRRLEYDVVIEHTAAGFRRQVPEPPAHAPHRVLFLGDSFTYGVGVGQGEVFTDHLQRALGPRVAVVNRGVIAYGTAQEYLLLRRELARSHYDRAAVLFYHNDLDNNLNGRHGERPWFELVDGELVPRNQPALPIRNVFERLLQHSRLQLLLAHRWDIAMAMLRQRERGDVAPGVQEGPPIDYHSLQGYAVTRRLFLEMDRVAREHGTQLFLVFVPLEGQLHDLPSREPYAHAVREMMHAIAREDGLRLVDLAPAFHARHAAGNPIHFPIDYHWNADGHRAAAEELLHSPLLADWAEPASPEQGAPRASH